MARDHIVEVRKKRKSSTYKSLQTQIKELRESLLEVSGVCVLGGESGREVREGVSLSK